MNPAGLASPEKVIVGPAPPEAGLAASGGRTLKETLEGAGTTPCAKARGMQLAPVLAVALSDMRCRALFVDDRGEAP